MMQWIMRIVSVYIFATMIIGIIKRPSSWPEQITVAPLTVFLMLISYASYATSRGLAAPTWQTIFIISGVSALLVTVLQMYKNILLDRLMLGVNVFFMVGTGAFLGNILPVLYIYRDYNTPTLFVCIVLVGIASTFCTKEGFIGVEHVELSAVRYASLQLLVVSVLGLIWSLAFNTHGITISGALPFIAIKVAREALAKRLQS